MRAMSSARAACKDSERRSRDGDGAHVSEGADRAKKRGRPRDTSRDGDVAGEHARNGASDDALNGIRGQRRGRAAVLEKDTGARMGRCKRPVEGRRWFTDVNPSADDALDPFERPLELPRDGGHDLRLSVVSLAPDFLSRACRALAGWSRVEALRPQGPTARVERRRARRSLESVRRPLGPPLWLHRRLRVPARR